MEYGTSASQVARVIAHLADGQLFSVQDLKPLGLTEATLRTALGRLCRFKIITRVAQGIYIKGTDQAKVSIIEIARMKARSYGKVIWEIEGHQQREDEFTFATDGNSSTFRVSNVKVRLIRMSPRKRVGNVVPHSPLCNACSFQTSPVSNFVYNFVHNR